MQRVVRRGAEPGVMAAPPDDECCSDGKVPVAARTGRSKQRYEATTGERLVAGCVFFCVWRERPQLTTASTCACQVHPDPDERVRRVGGAHGAQSPRRGPHFPEGASAGRKWRDVPVKGAFGSAKRRRKRRCVARPLCCRRDCLFSGLLACPIAVSGHSH